MTAPAEALRNRDHAAALIGALVADGVRHAVISPGSRNTPIVLALDALARSGAPVTLHSVLDERSAGFFALGLARASGAPTILSCTSGSAGAHYLPAIIEASHAHIPLIALTADRPPELQNCGAPQTIDQRDLFGVHVRRCICLSPPSDELESVRSAAAIAIEAATGAQSGPVHINAPYRKPLWHPEAPAVAMLPTVNATGRAALKLEPDALNALCARVQGAQRGLLVWGPDPDPSLDPSRMLDLAEHLGWPVLAAPTSPARLRNPRPGSTITAHDAFLRSEEIAKALAPDLVLQLGGTPSSNALRSLVGASPDVVAIDPHGVWRDPEHSLKTLLEVDPGPLAEALIGRIPGRAPGEWLQSWRDREQAATGALEQACLDGWWAGAIVHTLMQALPEDALLNVASSMPIRDVDTFGRLGSRPVQATANRGVNGIDGTLATTLGLARAWTRGPSVALMGDLAFLHDHGSLMLAAGLSRPVVVLVVDNHGGGIFAHLPIAEHTDAFTPWFLTPQDTPIPSLCEGAGVACARIEDAQALAAALPSALQHPGLTVLHLPIDGQEDLARHRAAWTAAQGQ